MKTQPLNWFAHAGYRLLILGPAAGCLIVTPDKRVFLCKPDNTVEELHGKPDAEARARIEDTAWRDKQTPDGLRKAIAAYGLTVPDTCGRAADMLFYLAARKAIKPLETPKVKAFDEMTNDELMEYVRTHPDEVRIAA